jgi:energy-coupling factor transporter ATP-binding protein EcfA2
MVVEGRDGHSGIGPDPRYGRRVRIEVRNIGPVNRGEIDLNGFAVVVGPNGSGKTTLSTLCYAALISYGNAEYQFERQLMNRMLRRPGQRSLLDDDIGDQFLVLFRDLFADELSRCFTPDLEKLPRRGRWGSGSAPRIVISDDPPGDDAWKVAFRIRKGSLVIEHAYEGFATPRFRSLRTAMEGDRVSRVRRRLRATRPVYFPASRSGFVQMQSVIASLLYGALGRGYFDQISIGKISGVAADFLQFIASIDPDNEAVIGEDEANRLEAELLRGHVRMRVATEASKVIEFAPEGIDEYWTMDAAATSVGEVAPLLLYLRHEASARDLLFIDEPEAHLHPGNQLVLASVLMQLAAELRGMVVGTHSEFFVQGVSNGLLRSAADDIEPPTVELYELLPAQSTGGYVTEKVEVDPHAGFVVQQFSDVAEQALDEAEDLFVRAQRAE